MDETGQHLTILNLLEYDYAKLDNTNGYFMNKFIQKMTKEIYLGKFMKNRHTMVSQVKLWKRCGVHTPGQKHTTETGKPKGPYLIKKS